jgi:hypothetical protein
VVDRLDLGGRSHKQRRIGAVIHDGHVRARTLPDDPALDDLRTDWGEVEYVPAADLKGAVEARDELRAMLKELLDVALVDGYGETVRDEAEALLDQLGGQ